MVWAKFKWKCIFFTYIILFNVFTKSLPLINSPSSLKSNIDSENIETNFATKSAEESLENYSGNKYVTDDGDVTVNANRSDLFKNVRPGQTVRSYELEITINGDSFNGRALLEVNLTPDTREDSIVLHVEDLNINSVRAGIMGGSNMQDVDFGVDDGELEISPGTASTHMVLIEYSGQLSNNGRGLYLGGSDQNTYLAMNLHPTYARRVFPCMDEPTEASIISFSFEGLEYNHLTSNAMLEENSQTHFRPLVGPPHLWGMIAHNFGTVNLPTSNVVLYARPGISNQESQASVAINFFFNNLNEWTQKPYFEVIENQDGRMNIMVLPDVSTDWNSLSTVGIWEPYVLMEPVHAVKQRAIALTKIAEAMSRQWFGYVIYPQNWRYEWVVAGFTTYSAYEMMRMFQADFATDINLLDVNTLFVTEVIQESLLRDAYINSNPLEPADDLFDEDAIRDHVNGLVKIKSAAIMRMIRLVLGDDDTDFIQIAARALLNMRSLETINTLKFIDGINSELVDSTVGDFDEYLDPWITSNGYPLLRVETTFSGVLLHQTPFAFTNRESPSRLLPITYTTSIEKNFDNIHPQFMLDINHNLNVFLDEEDWILFNIQGQGYYRVTYDTVLWERIIEALEDPDRREEIHPLNRATLVDDALNLARAGQLGYDIAFSVVLSMEHETEYAVWKAFVRNMNFLKKRLEAFVFDDDDLDPDIYLRMVRRTIPTFEREIGFYPDTSINEPSMTSLTRGLVMDHACRAGYRPCIAAAVDWFYDPNNNEVVNPNIPHEIRPAVYCTMVREGGEDAIEALLNRLEIEPTHYERVVILESLACSDDPDFINGYLMQTIVSNSPYSVEERVKIFAAVAESSYTNADLARDFMRLRVNEIRNMYGVEKLEQLIYVLAENMADGDLTREFEIWVQSSFNNLEDSQMTAERALAYVQENQNWGDKYTDDVYEWIDENHAPTLVLSLVALCVSVMAAIFNN
uniref:Aminopeptidase N 9 n=1 Tax=Spodoptera frugiperda TaxID=7108 RepID=A0A9E9C2S7_SPOFR|nr:aminopeptidase N 9 [Spodoptera frugiperda]